MVQPSSATPDHQPPIRTPRQRYIAFTRLASGPVEVFAICCLLIAAIVLLVILGAAVNGHTRWQYLPLLTHLLVAALGIGFTALLLVRFRSIGIGWQGILLGFSLLNCPLILAALGSHFDFETKSPLYLDLYHHLPSLGGYLLVISILHLLVANIYAIMHGRQLQADIFGRDSGAKTGERVQCSAIPKCWEMYSCPEAVRKKCPNYVDQLPCWQRRIGCLCDHQFSAYLFQSPRPVATENPKHLDLTRVEEVETYPARLRQTKPRPWRIRKAFCHNCAIFLEHQAIKYRRLNWLFLPLTLMLVTAGFRLYDQLYNFGARYLDSFSRHLMVSGHLPEGLYSDATFLTNSPYEYVLLGVLTILLMSYVVEFTDRCLLEWML